MHKTSKHKLFWLAAISLIAGLSFIGCKSGIEKFDATGSFETREILVGAEGNGKILTFSLEEGQIIKAGQEVGHIDSTQLELKRKQVQAMKASAESRLSDADIQTAALDQQINAAMVEKERVESLLKVDAANRKQLDDVSAQLAVLEKQRTAQRNIIANRNRGVREEVQSLAIQIEQLDDQIEKCRIVSPIDGTVLITYAEAGEITGTGKALFKISDLTTMYLRAYISADQLTRLQLGQNVKVIADFGTEEGRFYSGLVSWISDKAEFTPKTIQTKDERANLVYAIKIAVKNDGYLKIGMYGRVLFNEK